MIDERPSEVETRKIEGHWEGNLINEAKQIGNIVTLVERKSRFTLVGYFGTKEAQKICDKICEMLGKLPTDSKISLTPLDS